MPTRLRRRCCAGARPCCRGSGRRASRRKVNRGGEGKNVARGVSVIILLALTTVVVRGQCGAAERQRPVAASPKVDLEMPSSVYRSGIVIIS